MCQKGFRWYSIMLVRKMFSDCFTDFPSENNSTYFWLLNVHFQLSEYFQENLKASLYIIEALVQEKV